MAETYRAGSSQEGFGVEPGSYHGETSHRSDYPTHDLDARADVPRNVDSELRRRRRADLFFEDSVVLLGILLGGAVGYMTATTVRPGQHGAAIHLEDRLREWTMVTPTADRAGLARPARSKRMGLRI
jgi:hypothetical protein